MRLGKRRCEAFVVDPTTGRHTNLVLREVQLKLTRQAVEALPTVFTKDWMSIME